MFWGGGVQFLLLFVLFFFLDSGLSVELFTTIKVMHTFFLTVMCSIFLSKAK